MGSGSSRPETVYETIYQVDNCRPPIMNAAMDYTNAATRRYEKCAQDAAAKMWMEVLQRQNDNDKQTQAMLFDMAGRIKRRQQEDAKFCYNIEKKYKPFGIEGPAGLDCQHFEESVKGCRLKDSANYDGTCETGKKISPPKPKEKNENGEVIPNVVILGNTGVGKSYYGNGIMGNLDPNTGYFGTSNSHVSCTRGATGVSGFFYNQLLTSYGVEPMEMNFYDTPGFADSDPCQIEKNKERIAAALENPIHAFVFLTDHSNSRINANQQMLFKMLNEWTMGHIWNNFVIAYPRMKFNHNEKMDRIDQATSFYKELEKKKEELKSTLWKMATKEEWKKRNNNDQLVPMEKRDFDNIRVNALNVHQNTVCHFTDEGRIDKRKSDLARCSQLAYIDKTSLDYIISDDSTEMFDVETNPFATDSFSTNPFATDSFPTNPFSSSNSHGRPRYDLYDDKWVFIEEAKKLQQAIKDFSKRPVTPQKLYWKRKYEVEKAAYDKRYDDSSPKINTIAFEAAGIDTKHCDQARDKDEAEIKRYKDEALAKCPS